MRILVTGGAGFIGSNLIEKLLKDRHEVVCFDNLSTGTESNMQEFRHNIKFVKGDANTEDLDKVFKNHAFDYVFHHAAVVGVDRTLENPLKVLKDINGIKKILELSRKHDVKKIVYASSSEVYGEPVHLPEKEDGVTNAKLPYAVVKLVGENYFKAYFQEFGLKTCSLRFFNVYGPKQNNTPYGFVVGIFIKQALNNQRPTVFGDGSQTRDFVYVEDNVGATIEALKSDKTNGEVLNIGTGNRTTILNLAETIIKLCNKDLKPEFLPPRKLDIKHRQPDVTKMANLIRFKPRLSLEDGLKKTIDGYTKNVK